MVIKARHFSCMETLSVAYLLKETRGGDRSMVIDEARLEREVLEFGREIFEEVKKSSLSIFDPHFYSGKLMNWAMQDADFKVQLLRFVDVLPSLSSSASIIRHAQEYFQPVRDRIPGILKWGLDTDPEALTSKVAAQVIKKQVRSMAEQFIAGEDPEGSVGSLRKIRSDGLAFTVDLLGEAVVSEQEAETYISRYIELLNILHRETPKWPESKPLVASHRGEETPVNISVKLSALYSQASVVSTNQSVAAFSKAFSRILAKAKELGAFVYIDMEDSSLTTITIETFKTVLESAEFRDFPRCGIVLQAYMRRTAEDVRMLLSWGAKRGVPFGVRLVKGAYWDTETIAAKQAGWQIPVWQEKSASDANYEKLTRVLLENHERVIPAFGSHNIRSLVHAIKAAEILGVKPTQYELQFLYGMAEPIKRALAKRGYLVREYVPIGELLPGMGYLVRRLLENTSNEGFLRQSFHEHERAEVLLRKPEVRQPDTGSEHCSVNPRVRFVNSAFADFSLAETRSAVTHELATLRNDLSRGPKVVKPVIAGTPTASKQNMPSVAPEAKAIAIAEVQLADRELTDRAVSILHQYFPQWRDTPAATRAEILFRAAELMEEKRSALTALIILEAGKPWVEADADVAEAIDFCTYYAHQAQALFTKRKLGDFLGEDNTYSYEPRGVTAVICPWNFPIAIPCGMFAAALVTGNCAILKPAEQTSAIASALFDVFAQAGLPKEAAAFLPGLGEEVGAQLVTHPLISTIVFTGSKDVGLAINLEAARSSETCEQVKRVIVEMGGKNAIIVDEDADLDEAVKGVLKSAFGYQGQKCSACSRVIVVGGIYEKFAKRLVEATENIIIGPASDPGSFMSAVIDDVSHRRITETINRAKLSCKLLGQGKISETLAGEGYYVPPTIFGDVPANHELLEKEIFGPVVALVQAETFAQAIDLAVKSEYALTGAVFSRSPRNIAYAREHFRVGNLYLNRGSTGALVYRQPFGGAKKSGIGSKAGGPDYLLQFVIPRVVTENTMRRGFAPT